MTILTVIVIIFQLWALIDILRNEFTGYNKIIWLLIVILLPLLGIIFYYFIGRGQKVFEIESKANTVQHKS